LQAATRKGDKHKEKKS